MSRADGPALDDKLTSTSDPAPATRGASWRGCKSKDVPSPTSLLALCLDRAPANRRQLFQQVPTKGNLVEPMAITPEPASRGVESTHPVLPHSPLAAIFYPRTVAVIGATEKPASV